MYRVGANLLEIRCFRTLPGQELPLAVMLENHGKVPFKGLGAFDVFSFATSGEFTEEVNLLLPSSTITSVIVPCFPFESPAGGQPAKIVANLQKHSCISLSFLKLNPNPVKNYATWKTDLIAKLLKSASDSTGVIRYVLGTIGWYELVVISCADDLNTAMREALEVGNSCPEKVSKTYSAVCVRLKELQQLISPTPESSLPFPEKIPHRESGVLVVSLSPSATRDTHIFWSKTKRYDVFDSLGREDIEVIPKNDNITWGIFLKDLLAFRKEHCRDVLYTQLRLAQEAARTSAPPLPEESRIKKSGALPTGFEKGSSDGLTVSHPSCHLEADESEWLSSATKENLFLSLGKGSAERLILTVEYLRSLQRSRVEGSAFEDLERYVTSMPERFPCPDSGDLKPFPIRGHIAAKLIKEGIELRLHGIHGTMGEIALQLPPLRTGVHRILTAIETFTYLVIWNRFQLIWSGFVNASSERFFSSVEIINMPYANLYTPTDWWGLYHEIGHIFILANHDENFLTRNTPTVNFFLASTKGNQEEWLDLLHEVAAEIIGFELGFYNDFHLFSDCLWKYLKNILEEERDKDDESLSERRLAEYFIRSFAVKLYNEFIRGAETDEIPVFEGAHSMYPEFCAYIEDVYKNVLREKVSHSEVGFLAAKHSRTLVNMKKFLFHVRDYLEKNNENKRVWPLPQKCEVELSNEREPTNTSMVVKSVLKGEVWSGPVNFPEAVLYLLMKHERNSLSATKPLSSRQRIAMVLTLWNQYRQGLPTDSDDNQMCGIQ